MIHVFFKYFIINSFRKNSLNIPGGLQGKFLVYKPMFFLSFSIHVCTDLGLISFTWPIVDINFLFAKRFLKTEFVLKTQFEI